VILKEGVQSTDKGDRVQGSISCEEDWARGGDFFAPDSRDHYEEYDGVCGVCGVCAIHLIRKTGCQTEKESIAMETETVESTRPSFQSTRR
jgi:hypothetical protein